MLVFHLFLQSLSKRYVGAPPEAIDLLTQMLHFDPRRRVTVEQALDHPYLAPVRDKVCVNGALWLAYRMCMFEGYCIYREGVGSQ